MWKWMYNACDNKVQSHARVMHNERISFLVTAATDRTTQTKEKLGPSRKRNRPPAGVELPLNARPIQCRQLLLLLLSRHHIIVTSRKQSTRKPARHSAVHSTIV
jgi:hypothetical protein